jgi:hypothetical protein
MNATRLAVSGAVRKIFVHDLRNGRQQIILRKFCPRTQMDFPVECQSLVKKLWNKEFRYYR